MDTAPPLDRAPTAEQVHAHVEKLLASDTFRNAQRSSALLKYLVEQTLSGKAEAIKEYALGVDVLGRGPRFDSRTDPIARVEASRLRGKLEVYYAGEGADDSIIVTLPKGGYVPQFNWRATATKASQAQQGRGRVGAYAPWVIAAIAGVIAIAAWVVRNTESAATRERLQGVHRFETELITDASIGSLVSNDLAISPDGKRVVFSARGSDGVSHLYVRSLDQPQAIPLVGTTGARQPFFSPDSAWVGFHGPDQKLKKMSLSGGAPVILCEALDLFGATWNEDGTIIAALDQSGTLSRIDANGGAPTAVIRAADDTGRIAWPQALPGGKYVLYTAELKSGADAARIEVQAVSGGERKVLVRGGTYARYLASGHLLYVNQGALFAAPFDLRSLRLTGPAAPIVDDISYSFTFGYAQYDVSRTGTLVFRRGAENRPSVLTWIDRAGHATPFPAQAGNYGWPRLSDDGQRLAVTVIDSGHKGIRVYDSASNSARTVVADGCDCGGLVWAGSKLIYGTRDSIRWIETLREPISSVKLTDIPKVYLPWSLNAKLGRLAFNDRTAEAGFNLWTVPVEVTDITFKFGKPDLFIDTKSFEHTPEFSPDGRWLAYSLNTPGLREIYVRRFPDSGYVVKIPNSDGSGVRWSPTRNEILYRSTGRQVMVVKYRIEGDKFIPEPPQLWSSHILADVGVTPNFDIAPGGERILAALPSASTPTQAPNHATFILNFDEYVRRKLLGK